MRVAALGPALACVESALDSLPRRAAISRISVRISSSAISTSATLPAKNRCATAPITSVAVPIPTSITPMASTFPSVLLGVMSPYPTVVMVVIAQ